MKATAVFPLPFGYPLHLDVVESAVSDGSSRPKRWRVTVVHGITPLPIGPGASSEIENIAITSCEVSDDGALYGTHPDGGIDPDERRLPREVAFAVERELRRIWEDDHPDKPRLQAVGFTTRPTLIWPSSGRPPTPPAMIAVQVRRALRSAGASDEKLFTKAREMAILRRKPDAREFTLEGKALLDLIDAAKAAITEAKGQNRSVLYPFPADVMNAADFDLEQDAAGKAT